MVHPIAYVTLFSWVSLPFIELGHNSNVRGRGLITLPLDVLALQIDEERRSKAFKPGFRESDGISRLELEY